MPTLVGYVIENVLGPHSIKHLPTPMIMMTLVLKRLRKLFQVICAADINLQIFKNLLKIATYLDPQCKTLPFLSDSEKRFVIDDLEDFLLVQEDLASSNCLMIPIKT